MSQHVPAPIKAEHHALHAALEAASRESGALGESAREVASLLQPHFVKEEQLAMPPLALLTRLAWESVTPEMQEVLALTRRLKAELPLMLLEHKDIVAALERFRARAMDAGRQEYVDFADALVQHARMEEEVLYPAAVLVGNYLELKLREREPV